MIVNFKVYFLLSTIVFALFVTADLSIADPPISSTARPDWLPANVVLVKDIQYVPGNDPAQRLDLYLPASRTGAPTPLVVWIHGGAWAAGDKNWCNSLYLVQKGYAAASIEYRFSQEALFPAQIQDCQAAIRWLRANSNQYHLDPKHIGVWGESAGGHLVSLLGTAGGKKAFPKIGGNFDQSDRVQAVVDSFGPIDFNTVSAQAAAGSVKNVFTFDGSDPCSRLLGVPLGTDPAKDNAVSPIYYITHDNPPFLILHGTLDNLVPFAQSLEMVAALQKARVPVYLQRFPGAGHGGSVFDQNPAVSELIETFFDKYLLNKKVDISLLPDSAVTEPLIK